MKIKLWMWNLWLHILTFVNGKFAPFVQQLEQDARKAAQAEQVRLADEFLREFRSRESYKGFKLVPRNPDPPNPFCKHLKGGTSVQGVFKDYNMAMHTFSDGTVKIWCLLNCGFVSRGPKDENWLTAKNLLASSTNRPSSSERGGSAAFWRGPNVRS
jgi:hypothetical protein